MGKKRGRLSIPHCETPKRPVALCDERATGRTLLLRHRTRGHATAGGLHADRGGREVDDADELPGPVGSADRRRGDESPGAGTADRRAIVDLNARGEVST